MACGDQGGIFFEIRDVRYESDPGAAGDLCPQPTPYGTAAITGSFGGAVIEEGGIYSFPTDPSLGLALRMK